MKVGKTKRRKKVLAADLKVGMFLLSVPFLFFIRLWKTKPSGEIGYTQVRVCLWHQQTTKRVHPLQRSVDKCCLSWQCNMQLCVTHDILVFVCLCVCVCNYTEEKSILLQTKQEPITTFSYQKNADRQDAAGHKNTYFPNDVHSLSHSFNDRRVFVRLSLVLGFKVVLA